MKVTVKRQVETTEEVEVDFPLFYRWDYVGDYDSTEVVGRIDATGDHIAIKLEEGVGSPKVWAIERQQLKMPGDLPEYIGYARTTPREFADAVQAARAFFDQAAKVANPEM